MRPQKWCPRPVVPTHLSKHVESHIHRGQQGAKGWGHFRVKGGSGEVQGKQEVVLGQVQGLSRKTCTHARGRDQAHTRQRSGSSREGKCGTWSSRIWQTSGVKWRRAAKVLQRILRRAYWTACKARCFEASVSALGCLDEVARVANCRCSRGPAAEGRPFPFLFWRFEKWL